ncbi:RHS repeat-associated core domain-containing protein [Streptomyces sp. NPDC007863]|uniref:RHS repeat-associated core domain-containing protein n=1 Tax=Streptomyces sp. NPDC007863 TaxID=3154894 RepID=UPI0033FCE8FC
MTATSTVWDNQCFTYDVLGELVNAWTSKLIPNGSGTGCKAANGTTWGNRTDASSSTGPIADASADATDTPAGLTNTAPDATTLSTDTNSYHQAFTYDWIGNRVTATDRAPAGTTTYTSTYNTTQPHTLASVASTPAGKETSYTYNPTGTTKTRNLPGTTPDQTLQWTAEHKLASNTVGTTKTTYVYDADGNRILEHTPNTGSTLYLGETELTTDTVGLITRASRAYAQAGTPTVVRTTTNQSATGHTLNVLLTDHLGTAHTTVEAGGTQPVTRRAFKPYGEPRGPKPANWPNKRTYLGVGIDDTISGLTHIGAREYDHTTGRFLSADPLIDITDPLQMNGYTYANGSPITKSDPTGLRPEGVCGGNSSRCNSDNDGTDASQTYHESWEYKVTGWKYNSWEENQEGKRTYNKPHGVNWGTVVLFHRRKMTWNGNTVAGIGRFFASGVDALLMIKPMSDRVSSSPVADGYDGLMGNMGVDTTDPGYEDGEGFVGMVALPFAGAKGLLKKCHSFLPETEVLMGDGTAKKIEDVQTGDVILTTDVATGQERRKKVVETIRTESDKEFVELTLATSNGGSVLITTSTHPFWVPELDSWIEAGDLASGDCKSFGVTPDHGGCIDDQ